MTSVTIRRFSACGALALLLPSMGFAQERLRPFSLGVLPSIPVSEDSTTTLAWPPALVTACDYFAQTQSHKHTALPEGIHTRLHVDNQIAVFGERFGIPFAGLNTRTEPPLTADPEVGTVRTLGACAQLYGWLANRTGAAALSRADAVRIHFALARLGKHLRNVPNAATSSATADVITAQAHVDAAKTAIELTMRSMGMLNRFSAGAFAGTPISSVGRVVMGPAGTPPRAISEESAEALSGSLVVETAHWGWPGENAWDASLRFRLAHEPAAVLLTSTAVVAPATTLILTSLQGISASMSGRIGLPSQWLDSEVSLVGTFGSHRLDEISAAFGSGDNAIHATLVDNGPGRWASFLELGLEAALFDNPIRVLHAEQGLVTPAITISAGYRRDTRLSRPTTMSAQNWTGTHDRLYVRFMVDTIKQLRRRDLAADAQTFDLGFGLEYDRPLPGRSTMTPSMTRFVIRGNINLIRATSPAGK